MGWFLQTPDGASPKLLANFLAECGPAQEGGAAFAFASAQGVKLLAAESVFLTFLNASKFTVIVGLDAITDTRAVDELRKLSKSHPNFKPKCFLHEVPGSIFHPKTIWLRTPKGGIIITGSGNLTSGGLKSNWEAMAVDTLSMAEMTSVKSIWDTWLIAHKKELYDLDDPKVTARAKANKRLKSKIKVVLGTVDEESAEVEAEIEAAAELAGEIEPELESYPILIAEIPKSGSRQKQVNFDKHSFVNFFGVDLDDPKPNRFFHVQEDGSSKTEKGRPPVPVKSRNYRFELDAAAGMKYPDPGLGVPIGVFERRSDSDFYYVILMPGQEGHELLANYLDETHGKTPGKLRRIPVRSNDLRRIWPDAPFFL